MFISIVKSIFEVFAKTFEFLIQKVNDNCVLFIANDFDIIITYDDRENEIYIDFDLSKYINSKQYSQELQFPVLLNLNKICMYLEISLSDFLNDKNLNLEERVRLKFKQFEIVWNELMQHENYKDILWSILLKERIELKNSNELQNLKNIIAKAHNLFKKHEYEKTIELLRPHFDYLGEYDKKIFEYSLKKTGH
jgi:hypothetical protein